MKTRMTYSEGAGRVIVDREPSGGWRFVATPGGSSKVGDVVVAYANRNEAGFRGRQWEVTLPGGGTVGDGQFGTLESAARATLALAAGRYAITVEMERISAESATDTVKAQTYERVTRQIDTMLDVFGHDRETVEAVIDAALDAAREWKPRSAR